MQSTPKKSDQINKETKFNKCWILLLLPVALRHLQFGLGFPNCRITELKIHYKINIFLLLTITVKIFVLLLLLGILTIRQTVWKSISCFINNCVVTFIQWVHTTYTWYKHVCEVSYYVTLNCSPNSIMYCQPTHPKHFHFSYLNWPQHVKLGFAAFSVG